MRLAVLAVLLAAPALAGCAGPWDPCFLSAGCGAYHGVLLQVRYDAPWNATRAREAVGALGFQVERADERGLLAEQQGDLAVHLGAHVWDPGPCRREPCPPAPYAWALEAGYGSREPSPGLEPRASAEARAEREWEARFRPHSDAFLAGFEELTGWRPTSVERHPMMAVP